MSENAKIFLLSDRYCESTPLAAVVNFQKKHVITHQITDDVSFPGSNKQYADSVKFIAKTVMGARNFETEAVWGGDEKMREWRQRGE